MPTWIEGGLAKAGGVHAVTDDALTLIKGGLNSAHGACAAVEGLDAFDAGESAEGEGVNIIT